MNDTMGGMSMLRFCALILGTAILWLCAEGISCSADDPSQVYANYLAALESAKSFKDISSFLSSSRFNDLGPAEKLHLCPLPTMYRLFGNACPSALLARVF